MDNAITELAALLGQQLARLNAQVSSAESCTGGGIAEAITRIPGSSRWFEAGYVTYSNRQKTQQLGVSDVLLTRLGPVTQEVAESMAKGAQLASGARFAVATTGIAGPEGGDAQHPVGTVWLAWRDADNTYARCCLFQGGRLAIRQQAVWIALMGLIDLCQGKNPTFCGPVPVLN